ncbi:MAG TPA: primosomal protein N' [Cyanobacteria bacterium UBA8156]|nr:primosomal protein N' [Cyanobacteria bacterium UBA8156]
MAAVLGAGLFPPAYWALLQRVADYYRTDLVTVLKAALPPQSLHWKQMRWRLIVPLPSDLPPAAQALAARLQRAGDRGLANLHGDPGLGDLQQRGVLTLGFGGQTKTEPWVVAVRSPDGSLSERLQVLLAALWEQDGESPVGKFCRAQGTTRDTLLRLAHLGYVVWEERRVWRLEGRDRQTVRDAPKTLTAAQAQALAQIQALQGGEELLLFGETGSGKTEVYLQAIAPVLAQGRSALVLVPEIGLTPQLTDRFRARFGDDRVWVYHSGLAEGERLDTWRAMLGGGDRVVIGTRSAVFAPLPNLGMVLLDEEHDPSLKQEHPPCYHARTVARWRSQLVGVPLVLGSATPALETLHRAGLVGTVPQPMAVARLPQRIGDRPLPTVSVVDMRLELQAGHRGILGRSLVAALQEVRARGEQAILFIHRRGHSTFAACRSCGFVVECPHCDISLSYHEPLGRSPYLVCHYCNHRAAMPAQCPACGSPYFKHFGSGTQKLERELHERFPGWRVARFDSDTTGRKDAHRQVLTAFREGEIDVLVGTQMLVKGLDVPQVTLVGVAIADGLLHFADFRASERALQTLWQVVGRAGRGDVPGRAIVQTYNPDHPAIVALAQRQFLDFAAAEFALRQALQYPPLGALALLRLSAPQPETVSQAAERLAQYLPTEFPHLEVLGPAPAPVYRVADRYRQHLLLKGPEPLPPLPPHEVLVDILGDRRVRVSLDIDPQTLM